MRVSSEWKSTVWRATAAHSPRFDPGIAFDKDDATRIHPAELSELAADLPGLIKTIGAEDLFAEPRVTIVVYRKK